MSRDPRIVIKHFPYDLIREFHVNERIAAEKLCDSDPGVDSLARFSIRDHSPATIQTALSFYDIDGVTSVGLNIYEVSITISLAFDWDDVTPQVIDLIKKHLRWDDCEVRDHDSLQDYERGRSIGGGLDFSGADAPDLGDSED